MRKIFFLAVLLAASTMTYAHELCCYYGNETYSANAYVTLSWETAANGDVVITIGRGPGAISASFRNGGFEGGIEAFVVSTDNFVTSTPAGDYFTAEQVYSGNTYTLVKVANVPAGAQIKHNGSANHAFAWLVNGVNAYSFPDFVYTYGENCEQWAAPTNVAVSADSIITFTGVAGVEQYTAYVYLNGSLKHEQVVVSGDKLHFSPLASGTYHVQVIAFGNGKLESEPSAAANWELTAPELVLGASEYCGYTLLPEDNREAQMTWITNENGDVIITLLDTEGNESADFHFRGTGMALGSFMVGSTAANVYFNHVCQNNTVTLSLKDAANAPSLGEKITFNAVVEYATALEGNAWPTIGFEYTYGTACGESTTGVDAINQPSEFSHKLIENAQFIIIKNGVRYNAAGQVVR